MFGPLVYAYAVLLVFVCGYEVNARFGRANGADYGLFSRFPVTYLKKIMNNC